MENLYHYTDFNAMRGIITNGEIWLWNLRRMNDSQEMQYFIKELKIAVKKRIEASLYPKLEELFQENLKDFDKLSSYASCFSEYADDAAELIEKLKKVTKLDKDIIPKNSLLREFVG